MIKRLLFVIWVLLLAACGTNTQPPAAVTPTEPGIATASATREPSPTPLPPSATPTVEPTRTITPTATAPAVIQFGPDNFPDDVNPLTGLVVEDPELLDRLPISVKVDISMNFTRPPYGLSAADIVYNYYHNDGTSRYHAIFYGEDAELVGPIRSGRLLDDLLVRMYKSIFVYGNADVVIRTVYHNSNYASRLLIESNMAVCPPSPTSPLCRFEPNVNSSLLGGTSAISAYMETRGVTNARPNLDGMSFHSDAPEGGEAGTEVVTRYSQVDYNRFEYDPKTGLYMAFVDNVQNLGMPETYEPLVDRNTDEPIGVENVVVLIVRDDYRQRPPAEIVDIFLSDGEGEAYAFRDGQVYQVSWNRPTQDSVLYLTLSDGTAYPFKPGQTWFSVVNPASIMSQPEPGAYRFQYNIRP